MILAPGIGLRREAMEIGMGQESKLTSEIELRHAAFVRVTATRVDSVESRFSFAGAQGSNPPRP